MYVNSKKMKNIIASLHGSASKILGDEDTAADPE